MMRNKCECLEKGHMLEVLDGVPVGYAMCKTCGEMIPVCTVLNWYFEKLDGLINRVKDDEYA